MEPHFSSRKGLELMFEVSDFATIGVLVFLEGILSIDNALVLAIIARGVKPQLQKKVLTYGLIGAVVFRMTAIFFASTLIHYRWIKFIGGAYLLWLAVQYFFFTEEKEEKEMVSRGFWATVLIVELTDIAFAIDSILAAVALTNRYWVIVVGGLIGTFMMRFAANQFIKFLGIYPNLERTAYLLITIVGGKVVLEGFSFSGVDFHSSDSPWFWGQWILMVVAIVFGLKKNQKV
jgi:YkoY family integral membrane protein